MAKSTEDSFALFQDAEFNRTVTVLAAREAIDVLKQRPFDPYSPEYNQSQRRMLAMSFFQDIEGVAPQFVLAAASDPTITESSSAQDIRAVIADVWTHLSNAGDPPNQ